MTVYAVRAGDTDAVKIGFTHGDVDARVAQLQTGNAKTLRVLRTWPGGAAQERAAHFLLQSRRTSGEWFNLPAHLEAVNLDAIGVTLAHVPLARTFNDNLAEAHELIALGRAVPCASCSVDVETSDAVFCHFCEAINCPACAGTVCPRSSHVPARRRERAPRTKAGHVPDRVAEATDLP